MDILTVIVHWLHVLLGIFWFGSVLFLDFVLLPALISLPAAVQRPVAVAVGKILDPALTYFVAPAVIVLGALRGTIFGPINSLEDVFRSPYGLTWLSALVLAVSLFGWALLVLRPRVHRLNAGLIDETDMPPFIGQLKRLTLIELAGFLVLFTLMVLMRFGL